LKNYDIKGAPYLWCTFQKDLEIMKNIIMSFALTVLASSLASAAPVTSQDQVLCNQLLERIHQTSFGLAFGDVEWDRYGNSQNAAANLLNAELNEMNTAFSVQCEGTARVDKASIETFASLGIEQLGLGKIPYIQRETIQLSMQ
jgi:hypothetical protein